MAKNNTIPETWDQIEKVSWKEYSTDNAVFTELLNKEKFTKYPKINAINGIYNKNIEHFRTDPNPLKSPPIHDNIFDLLCSKELLRASYNKLKKNKGAITEGVSGSSADKYSEELIDSTHKQLKNNNYQWNPAKRINIEKPEKKGKTRPLGIPDFKDKLVQNNILIILTAIYDPEFEYLDCNFGFRPNKSCNDVIKHIRIQTIAMDVAIEGDIKGAYDNVIHSILIKILRRRIKDEKFLHLIYTALKAGYEEKHIRYDTFLGTPQGGTHSPILFNIYMNEFDKFIKFELTQIINRWNEIKQIKQPSEKSAKSDNARKRAQRIEKSIKELEENPKSITSNSSITREDIINIFHEIKEEIKETKPKKHKTITKNIKDLEITPTTEEINLLSEYDKNRKNKLKTLEDYEPNERIIIKKMNARVATAGRLHRTIRKIIDECALEDKSSKAYIEILKKKFRKEKKLQLFTEALDPKKKVINIKYYRYADDWILFLRGPISTAKILKKRIKEWLENNLKLELSPEKTLITNLRKDKARFLGFEIFQPNRKQIIRRKTQNKEFLQRYGNIQIMPDTERLTKNFQIKNILRTDRTILSVGFLTPLEDYQIIEKFNQFMIGLGLYYITEISRPSALNYWHYVLYYSCLKTLSHKHKSSIKKIIKNGYTDISKPDIKENNKIIAYDRRIKRKYTKDDGTIVNKVLLNYNEFMMQLKTIREKYRNSDVKHTFLSPTIDFLTLHKSSWRTKFKTQSMCSICGATKKLEMHHIKPIKRGLKNKNKSEK